MRIFDKIFGNKEEKKYLIILNEVSNPLMRKISLIREKDIRIFFEKIVDASEKVLRTFLLRTFQTSLQAEVLSDYRKEINKKEFNYWVEKVSLVMIAYSYYCVILVKNWYELNDLCLQGLSYEEWFNKVFSYYNQVFDKNVTKKDIDYYASGYKEDAEKGYSKMENEIRVRESCEKDSETIGSELLKEIWNENIEEKNKDKRLFIGGRIWESHKQLIRPYLEKLSKE